MRRKIIFHLTSAIVNFIIIHSVCILHFHLFEALTEGMYFIGHGDYCADLSVFDVLIFCWAAPFFIYKFRKWQNHIYWFVFIHIIVTFLSFIYRGVILSYDYYTTQESVLVAFLQEMLFAFKENLMPIILIPVMVHFSQMLIGKLLLPTLYKRNGQF